MRAIDKILNKITMYRLVLYSLIFMLLVGAVFGALGVLPYSPLAIGYSAALIFFFSWTFNRLFAFFFDAPSNFESTWLTALILALIISPPAGLFDAHYLALSFWASAWAVASKYIFAIRKKHVFNPAAFGVAVTGIALGLYASWWVSTLAMFPFVLAAGLLIVRKIRRFDLWWSFILTFLGGQLVYILLNGKDLIHTLSQSIFYAPVAFFSTVMLTEPLTTPPTRKLRVIYGILVGILFLPNFHINVVYFTPELALIMGNVFSYLASSKDKLILKLKSIKRLSPNVFEFAFAHERSFTFRPGQYMEWTLPHRGPDARGLRRFFTISSAPTEAEMKLGVKFYDPSSSFKEQMLSMRLGDEVVAAQLAGDFTLPQDQREKLVFIAGGIGSTPFRSMVQYLLDMRERRPITLIYQNNSPKDEVYKEIFERGARELGMRYVPVFSPLTGDVIKKEVPDFRARTFYISGPEAMVNAYKSLLKRLGVKRSRIKTDYFPGF